MILRIYLSSLVVLRNALIFTSFIIGLFTLSAGTGDISYDLWGPWGTCYQTDTCYGVHSRQRNCVDGNNTILSETECIANGFRRLSQDNITCIHNPIDDHGGWSTWESWSPCSVTCSTGTRTRSRSCDSPIPCNNGLPCPGDSHGTEDCDTGVKIDGDWTEWSNYSSCSVTMGHGVQVKTRTCTNPPACGGYPCQGSSIQTLDCEIIPDCFTGSVFGASNRNISGAMVFYLSARVDIIPQTKIKPEESCEYLKKSCHYEWSLYSIVTSANESLYMTLRKSRFSLIPGEIFGGTYRLYVKISYHYMAPFFVEGSMYLEAIYPPPNAFIIGGSGRLVGPGLINLDAKTGSYDLIQGPGHSDNLTFAWSCIQYPSENLVSIIDLVVNPEFLFSTTSYNTTVNWSLLKYIQNITEWTDKSSLFDSIKALNESIMSFDYVVLNHYNITHPYDECANLSLSMYSAYVSTLITESCNILDHVLSLTWNWAEYDYFTNYVLSEITVENIVDVGDALSLSYTEINAVSALVHNVSAYSEWGNLYSWLNETLKVVDSIERLQVVLQSFEGNVPQTVASYSLHEQLSEKISHRDNSTIIYHLARFAEAIENFQYYDFDALMTEEYNLRSGIQKAYDGAACSNFTVTDDGYSEIVVSETEVEEGIGFIVSISVNKQGTVSYFQQRIQTELPNATVVSKHLSNGGIPELLIQCYLNCMQKVASTSVMSLRAVCLSCSYTDLLTATYVWDIQKFDPIKRVRTVINDWQQWLETDANDSGFVIKAGSFESNANYIVTVTFQLQSGEKSTSVLMIETTYPPYGGYCRVSNNKGDRLDIAMDGWMDEGFRSERNSNLDWKEQISFRVMQRDKRTNATTLLYHGKERYIDNVKVIYGYPEDNYMISVYVQVFDIFSDYVECALDDEVIEPPVQQEQQLDGYIENSLNVLENAIAAGDAKAVSQTVETVASTVIRNAIPQSHLSNDASEWQNIGVAETENGTVTYSFSDILESFLNASNDPTKKNLTEAITSYSDFMKRIIDQTDMKNVVTLGQAAHSTGTLLQNKDLVDEVAIVNAMNSSDKLINYFVKTTNASQFPVYEDFLSTSEAIIRAFDFALAALLPSVTPDFPDSVDIYTIQQDLAIREEFSKSSSDLTEMEKAYFASLSAQQIDNKHTTSNELARETIPRMLTSMRSLGSVVGEMSRLKQLPVFVNNIEVNTSSVRMDKIQMGKEEIKRGDVALNLSPPTSQFNTENDIQVTLYDQTPFTWDDQSKYIASPTLSLSVVTVSGGNVGQDVAMPIKVRFNTEGKADHQTVQLAIPSDSSDSDQVFFYKFYWRSPQDDFIFCVQAQDYGLDHHVYLRQGIGPTKDNYDWSKTVSPSDWIGSNFYVHIPGGLYNSPCLAYIAVNAVSGSNGSRRKKRSTSSNSTLNIVTYTVSSWSTGCRVWDSSTNKWDKTACVISQETTSSETVCDCQNPPGNNFATTFYVPPNTIDFSSVFNKFDILNNGAVFGTVIAIIGVYVLIAIWARRQDKNDIEKWNLSYLKDNLQIDDYLYLLTVYTGLQRNSGTKSNVSFVLTSDKHDTGVRRLEGSKKGFETGSVCRFVMSVPKCIGDMNFLNIWHDNSGEGNDASWFLHKIVVDDLQTGHSFTFLCNEWLSVDEEFGKIQRVLYNSDESTLRSFGVNFQEYQRQNVTENHLWLSVVMRPEKSKFTRLQRLSCCLALLFLTMISNAMFFGQDNSISQINIGPLKLSLSIVYVSVISICITTPPLLLITIFFKKCKPSKMDNISEVVNDQKEGKKSFMLPRCFYFIAWILVALSVLVPGFFVILYSMEWGKDKSEEWLKCFFLAFLESVCLVDPIKVLALTILLSLCLRKSKSEWTSEMFDRTEILQETKRNAATSVRESVEIPQQNFPLDNATIDKLKSHRRDEIRTKRILIELILYLLLLTVLYVVSFSIRDTQSYFLKDTVEKHLTTSPNNNVSIDTLRFQKVISVDDYYEWVKTTLLPYVFSTDLYNGDTRNKFERMYVKDITNFRVGPIRLRQVRSKEVKCRVPIIDDLVCFDDYMITNEETDSYCIGWNQSACTIPNNELQYSTEAWRFTSALEDLSLPSNGLIASYGGGGYIADLGVNLQVSNLVIDELMENSWIDRQTRALFTEFTLYNGNANLFTHVSMLAEFPVFGGVLTSYSIRAFRLYQHLGDTGVFVFVCELIFALAIIVFAIKLTLDTIKHKNLFFADMWRLFDLVIVVTTLVAIGMYIVRLILTNKTTNCFLTNKHKFVNFGHIATWDEILNAFVASIVFLTTIRILRVLSYSHRLSQLAAVLSHGGKDLAGVFIMFFIVFFAYITFGYLLFGKTLHTYRNFLASMTTISNAIIGRNNINGLMDTSPGLAQVYYFTFVFFVLWILITMLNAALNKSITYVKHESEHKLPTYGITDLVSHVYMNFYKQLLFLSRKREPGKRPPTSLTVGDIDLDIPAPKISYPEIDDKV